MGYTCQVVKVGKADREVLESWLCARTTPHELALRAHILLAGADGESVRATVERLHVATNTVTLWRRRYRAEALARSVGTTEDDHGGEGAGRRCCHDEVAGGGDAPERAATRQAGRTEPRDRASDLARRLVSADVVYGQ